MLGAPSENGSLVATISAWVTERSVNLGVGLAADRIRRTFLPRGPVGGGGTGAAVRAAGVVAAEGFANNNGPLAAALDAWAALGESMARETFRGTLWGLRC